ncbi:hypothetical protein NEUTE1DRAFT_111545 [Neurospora tetrasperma FGSC 2508]|uniref:Uncharacterized protein n=1 Tax=Neurospora tetrasperma (strain FGSC 2508 / ATCC MYA-4615 / P0657) TaxID=510951 RepID=F8MRR2_NEUT8|nr:uncharacterized protein NEUTE1DRAFT_111545 [Neurospora tetrasperma FGSC 2508]EGO54959.1 hypothetical protein NEUTE1DRAFT_111545 [Neurospora tetrasperma FGSC 2508]EGZ69850.1 hypothetical protein NEUTE2DRAFT_71675 [Neurospora tetrasperma FGSC 2509]
MAYPPRKALAFRLTFLAVGFLLLGILPRPTDAVHRYNEPKCCLDAVASNKFTLNITRDPDTGAIVSGEAPICGQMYNGTLTPAPEIKVSYDYCMKNCGGFGLSKGDEPGQWAAPIVQFLLPSVIFSMNVPRRHILLSTSRFKDWIWRILPRPQDGKARKAVTFLVGIVLLALDTLSGAFDALLWIVVVMGMAGPMMVGGLHEAVLDYKIVRALKKGAHRQEGAKGTPPTLQSLRDTVEILVTAISGNLVMGEKGGNPEDEIKKALLADFPEPELEIPSDQSTLSSQRTIGPVPQIPPIALLSQMEPSGQDMNGPQEPERPPILVAPPDIKLQPVDREASKRLRERLTRLISSQLDFAATIGAPVVFYLGAFIYTILDLKNEPSDQDAAISLAFGVEWMIIVHVAIVGGCLLASNNPSPVVLLVGKEASKDKGSTKDAQWRYYTRKNAFDGLFQPVNMWKRGMNKSKWLRQSQVYRKNKKFRDRVKIHWLEHCGWIIQTFILIALPPSAGAVVALKTPPVGWSCRSLSFVTYSASQFLLTFVYFAYLNMWERDQARHENNQGEDPESGQQGSRNTYQAVHEREGSDTSANGNGRSLEDLQQVHTAPFRPRTPSMDIDMDMDDEGVSGRGRYMYGLREIPTTTNLLPSTPSPGPSPRHIPDRDPSFSPSPNQNLLSSPYDPCPPRPSISHLRSNTPTQRQTIQTKSKPRKSFLTLSIYALFTVFFFLSLFLSIGTTLMQIMGVYRNCFCYITVGYWFDTSNPDAMVNVASDTWYQRHSSRNWMVMGGVATAFMAACAYIGWWFQGMIRRELAGVVEGEVWPGYGNKNVKESGN